ncbi:AMP-binding protein [Bradyrhizobium sp. CCBAU 51765]|uniref:AMP-binding protein n=1 Tax=Bradyrhizobium sp. CCBAU 51765 TaxID=1325102 RepID=UPI0018888AA2|nr:AMP-binding protein [Bradyrhizobium sp. CCBAU 51765]
MKAQSRPNETAFVFEGEGWTYRRGYSEAIALSTELLENGVRAGDRVALHLNNGPEMIAACYTCFTIGALLLLHCVAPSSSVSSRLCCDV